MLRTPELATAMFAAALVAGATSAEKETLRLEIRKENKVLDTVTIHFDSDQPPTIEHPQGAKWEDLREDSTWQDAEGYHVRKSRSFHAVMGSRVGFGGEYIHSSYRGDDPSPILSANLGFVFPGDTTVQINWDPMILYPHHGLAPMHRSTAFVSGCEMGGQVSRYLKDGTVLTQIPHEYAFVLTRKKERPVGVSKPVASRKETLFIQHGKQNSDNGGGSSILDTLVLWIDYGKPPEVAPPGGRDWDDFEKDSSWNEEESWGIQYSHSFMAAMGSRKGHGGEYLSTRVFAQDFNAEPQYNAQVAFTIPGDTALYIFWDPAHMVEKAEAYPYQETAFRPGSGQFGQVQRQIGKGPSEFAQGEWVKLIKREDGWTGFDAGGSTAIRPARQAETQDGWLFNRAPGALMAVPPGAKGLRILDLQGRLHWQTRNLTQGIPILLPSHLPQKAMRYQWVSEPG